MLFRSTPFGCFFIPFTTNPKNDINPIERITPSTPRREQQMQYAEILSMVISLLSSMLFAVVLFILEMLGLLLLVVFFVWAITRNTRSSNKRRQQIAESGKDTPNQSPADTSSNSSAVQIATRLDELRNKFPHHRRRVKVEHEGFIVQKIGRAHV